MDALFAVVGLVIAVTGAAFSCIYGFRELTWPLVDRYDDYIGQCNDNVSTGDIAEVKRIANSGTGYFNTGQLCWKVAFSVPLIIFYLYAMRSAYQVLDAYYDPPPSAPTEATTEETENQGSVLITPPISGASNAQDQQATSPEDGEHDHSGVFLDLQTENDTHRRFIGDCIACQLWWLWWIFVIDLFMTALAFLAAGLMWRGVSVLASCDAIVNQAKDMKPVPRRRQRKSTSD